ncbi:MAG: cobalt-precorrin-5B (C(1))-methyltransferase [Bilophila wadsworthia]
MKQTEQKTLRWGYSTGACAAAVATAAWLRLTRPETPCPQSDAVPRWQGAHPSAAEPDEGHMAAIRKDGGDDPDCTHGAILFGNMRRCSASDARKEDYTLSVGGGTVILRGAAGVGLCTRPGLDCEQGKWAINTGPRRMIAENLHHAGLDAGCWLLEIGVENGEELAKHTLNPLLGVVGGISILGTTGLVRPYSHEAYIETVRICVKSHHIAHGTTNGVLHRRTHEVGAERRLPSCPKRRSPASGTLSRRASPRPVNTDARNRH